MKNCECNVPYLHHLNQQVLFFQNFSEMYIQSNLVTTKFRGFYFREISIHERIIMYRSSTIPLKISFIAILERLWSHCGVLQECPVEANALEAHCKRKLSFFALHCSFHIHWSPLSRESILPSAITMVSVSNVQPSINLEFLCTYKNLRMSLYTLF